MITASTHYRHLPGLIVEWSDAIKKFYLPPNAGFVNKPAALKFTIRKIR